MPSRLSTTIDNINQLLDWFKKYKPEQYEQMFINLAERRSQLHEMEETLKELPAIAAYGESQKGKSYLIGNLLQKDGKPFMVSSADGSFDFVKQLNPIGNGKEATGVATRLSSFKQNPGKYDKRYPVIMKVFSIADLVCVLSDGMHNDVIDYVQHSDAELIKRGDELIDRYSNQPVRQSVVSADDIMKILRYIRKFIPKAQNIPRNNYLQRLAQVIQSVPLDKMEEVFRPLWIDDDNVSALFSRLLNLLKRFDFAKEVYLPIDSISHEGIKSRTIMSVDCLKGLYENNFPHKTDVFIKNENGGFTCLKDIDRSELSALCAEIVIRIDPEFLEGNMTISTEAIAPSVKSKLEAMPGITAGSDGQSLVFSRNLLQYCDLLDFPGARSRESLTQDSLLKIDKQDSYCNMIKIILRGKVAYLFSDYSAARRVNMLMFCHDAKNVSVTQMYLTIQDWVNRYVGSTPEQRTSNIKTNNGVSPLFVISTMLNLDMVHEDNETANNWNAVKNRWNGRFGILHQDCLHVDTNNWFRNWMQDRNNKLVSFSNTYMLRDFKYSACTGTGSHLYSGFESQEPNPREKELVLSPEFYDRLRSTFLEEDMVGNFIDDKETAWDLSASINNDGASWIIYNMTRGAEKLEETRKENFKSYINDSVEDIYKIVDNLYERDESDNTEDEIRKLSNILFSLVSSCNSDNSFFGRMINAMQLKSKETYMIVHEAITNPDIVTSPATHKKGELFRKLVDKYKTRDEKLKQLMKVLGFRSEEEAKEKLALQGVDLTYVVGEAEVRKETLADLVAKEVMSYWTKKMLSPELLDAISMTTEDSSMVPSLITGKMVDIAKGLGITEIASEAIAPIVNVTNMSNINESLVADIIRNIINGFVTDWGYSYRSAADLEIIREKDRIFDLSIEEKIADADEQSQTLPDLDQLSDLFDDVSQGPDAITESFNDNFFRWVACMKTGFICKTPKTTGPRLGIEANMAIGEIFHEVQNLNE